MYDEHERDKGGRFLVGKKWRVFNYVVEVAVESPGDVDESEAAEDADEFMATIGRTAGRVHSSYASITRADAYGYKRPKGSVVFINKNPEGEKVELELPHGIKTKSDYNELAPKSKPKKAKAKKAKKKNDDGRGDLGVISDAILGDEKKKKKKKARF